MAALKWAAVALGGAPFAVSVYALRGACAAAAAPETLRAAACEAYADWPVVSVRNQIGGLPALLFDVPVVASGGGGVLEAPLLTGGRGRRALMLPGGRPPSARLGDWAAGLALGPPSESPHPAWF